LPGLLSWGDTFLQNMWLPNPLNVMYNPHNHTLQQKDGTLFCKTVPWDL
jgi:hypothetical protein